MLSLFEVRPILPLPLLSWLWRRKREEIRGCIALRSRSRHLPRALRSVGYSANGLGGSCSSRDRLGAFLRTTPLLYMLAHVQSQQGMRAHSTPRMTSSWRVCGVFVDCPRLEWGPVVLLDQIRSTSLPPSLPPIHSHRSPLLSLLVSLSAYSPAVPRPDKHVQRHACPDAPQHRRRCLLRFAFLPTPPVTGPSRNTPS